MQVQTFESHSLFLGTIFLELGLAKFFRALGLAQYHLPWPALGRALLVGAGARWKARSVSRLVRRQFIAACNWLAVNRTELLGFAWVMDSKANSPRAGAEVLIPSAVN